MQTRSTTATKLAAFVAVAAAGFALVWAEPVVFLGLAAAAIALFFLPVGDWLVLPFFAVLTGATEAMSEHPVSIGGYTFYGADALLFLMASLPVARWLQPKKTRVPEPCGAPHESGVPKSYIAFFCWGILALAASFLLRDYPANNIIGGFRRVFFYSLAFPLVLLMPLDRRHLRCLPPALWTTFLLVTATGLYRLATGQTWRERQFVIDATFPSPRLLSHGECLALAAVLAYFTAILVAPGSRTRKIVAIPGAGIATALLFLSGYRLFALLAVALPLCVLMAVYWFRRERATALLTSGILGALLLGAAGLVVMLLLRDEVAEVYQQVRERVVSFSFKDDIRYYTWREALRLFSDSPLVGAGLGHRLTFAHRTSQGLFQVSEYTTHSMPITVLYQTGLPGLLLYLWFHISWIGHVLFNRHKVPKDNVPVLVALLSLYLCSFAVSLMQPLFVSSIIAMHMAMGLAFYLVRPASATTPGADTPWV